MSVALAGKWPCACGCMPLVADRPKCGATRFTRTPELRGHHVRDSPPTKMVLVTPSTVKQPVGRRGTQETGLQGKVGPRGASV